MRRHALLPTLLALLASSAALEPALAQNPPAAPDATPIRAGAPPLERRIAAGETHRYALDLAAKTFVVGEADQHTVDLVVTVVGPDGRTVSTFVSPARGPETFTFISDVAGRYRVEVKPFDRDSAGAYAMLVRRAEPVAAAPAARVDQLMAIYDRKDSPGAAIGVVRGGKLVFAKGYGMASLEYDAPITPRTPF